MLGISIKPQCFMFLCLPCLLKAIEKLKNTNKKQ